MSVAFNGFRPMATKRPTAWRQHKLALAMAVLVSLPSGVSLASDVDFAIDIWVQRAPLALVIEQIANDAGKSVKITGAIEGQVSGRFTGSLTDALSTLSNSHDVLFDLQGDDLNVISKRALSKISIFLPESDLDDSLRLTLDEAVFPGNTVSVQGVMVKVSGHPDFVKRIVKKISSGKSGYKTTSLAAVSPATPLASTSGGASKMPAADSFKQKPVDLSASDASRAADIQPASEATLASALATDGEPSKGEVISVKRVVNLSEGGKASVDDKAKTIVESKAPVKVSERSTASVVLPGADTAESSAKPAKRIKSVTDIPGFNTF